MLIQAPANITRTVSFKITALIVLMLLSGCSSKWKAPVQSYSSSQKQQSPIYSSTATPINSTYYRVKKGDTLYSIAWRTGRDFQDLAKWNRLQSAHTIYVGQVLMTRPPSKSTSRPEKKPASRPAAKNKKITSNTVSKKTQAKTEKENFKRDLRWRWPSNAKVIKAFKRGDDTRKGIVLSGKPGQSVLAAESGKIVYSGSGLIGYGQLIIIKHNNNYLSAYGHNRKLLVKEGEWVTKGNKIAEMGLNEAGVPALHFEIRKNGNPLNPVAVLPRRN